MRPFLLDRAGVRPSQDVELGVAADHRRHEVRGSAGRAADDAREAKRAYRLPLAPQVERTLLVEGEPAGCLGRPFGDQGLARACRGLQSRGHDDRLTGDHRITRRGAGRRDDLTGVDTDPDLQRHVVCPAEIGVDLVQLAVHGIRGPQRSGRVVLMGKGNAEHRHHGIADELLDGSALGLDLCTHGFEVALHHGAEPLRSSRSASVVDPTMSANRIVTSLRSSPPTARADSVGVAVVVVTRVPQWEQKRSVGWSCWPQARQVGAKAVPQDEQNLAPSAFAPPHAGHVITTRSLGAAHQGAATRAAPWWTAAR